MNKLSKKLFSYPSHGKVHEFQSINIAVCQVLGLRFTFLVLEKWRQEDSHKFEVSVVYIARYSLKTKQKTKKDEKPGTFYQRCNKNFCQKQLQGGFIC